MHEEVAQRMMARLDYIKAVPRQWLDWGPTLGGLQAHAQLEGRFPKARALVWEGSEARAQDMAVSLSSPWWSASRWRRGRVGVYRAGADVVDMVWANMGLHADPAPTQTMQTWHAALTAGGFLMFSCLGPDSLLELCAMYRDLQWPLPCHSFTDMHDLGDMLVAAGFSEPVMSMERIRLTYSSAEALMDELRGLGRNLSRERFPAMRARAWRRRWLEEVQHRLTDPESGRLALTFEIVYGHAFKASSERVGSSQNPASVSLDEVRAALAESRNRKNLRASWRDARQ